MVVKVHGLPFATCTRRVLATLEEKNVPYEIVMVDLMKGAHKQPEYLAKQPFGQIPFFEDGNLTMFESRAIARYVANKYAAQGYDLLGKTDQAKANTDTWLEVEACHYNPPVHDIVFEKVFKAMHGAGPADEAIVTASLAKLDKVLDVYEQVLKKQAYLAGPDFSLADLSHLTYTHYMIGAGVKPFEKHPAVKAWWEKISTRPSWVKLTAA